MAKIRNFEEKKLVKKFIHCFCGCGRTSARGVGAVHKLFQRTKGEGGVWKMLTMAAKGERGGLQIADNGWVGMGEGLRQMLTLGDKGGRGFWLLMISVTK